MSNEHFDEIVICKHCNRLEYYGKMMWKYGNCTCRDCYKERYLKDTGELYPWKDLDGDRPSEKEYVLQISNNINSVKGSGE